MITINKFVKYFKQYLIMYVLISFFAFDPIQPLLFKITEFGLLVAFFSSILNLLLGDLGNHLFAEIELWSARCVIIVDTASVLLCFCLNRLIMIGA